MRKLALLMALAAAAVPASATASGTSVVGAYGCIVAGGHVTRPAGTDILVRFGWIAKTPGLDRDFVNAQTTLLRLNGGATVDASGAYGAPEPVGEYWGTFAFSDTGIVLAPGQTLTFDASITLSHPTTDGIVTVSNANSKPASGEGTLFSGTCTVTGV